MREIASWPAWEVRLIDAYLNKQPAAEDRMEFALATLCAMFFNANRGKEQAARRMKDYLPFLDPWPNLGDLGQYSELDLEVMKALGE